MGIICAVFLGIEFCAVDCVGACLSNDENLISLAEGCYFWVEIRKGVYAELIIGRDTSSLTLSMAEATHVLANGISIYPLL